MIDRLKEFRADVLASSMTGLELAAKYGITERTVYKWKARLKSENDLPPATEDGETTGWKEDGNYAEAWAVTTRITTVDQLLIAAEVDLEDWDVLDAGVKKWEVGAKDKRGKLKWEDGKIIDGQLDYKGLAVQDLWSVWVKLRRRVVRPITATIHPVECPVTYKVADLEWGPVLQSLIWTDPQVGYEWNGSQLIPFHDREVMDLWLQIATWLQPARMDILGDWFDATGWTDHFISSPNTDKTTQPAILESHWWLRQFREACPNTQIRIHCGNHDKRLTTAILKHLPVAYELRSADEMELPAALHPARLLALHQLDIGWVANYPNDEDWLGSSIRLNHGVYYSAGRGNTTKKVVENSDVNTVTGHGHRSEHTSRTRHMFERIETLSAYSVGCTCRIDGVVPARHKYMDWQQSAAIVEFTDGHHAFKVVPVSLAPPKEAIVDGRLFTARNRVSDLTHDLPEYKW
jgi:hypothetical protein